MKTFKLIDLKGKLNLGDVVKLAEFISSSLYIQQTECIVTGISDDYIHLGANSYLWISGLLVEIIQSKTGFERDEVTWENLHVGDKLDDKDGTGEYIIGGISDKIIILIDDENDASLYPRTIKELREKFTIIKPKAPLEVTMDEVTEKFGCPVKIIKGSK